MFERVGYRAQHIATRLPRRAFFGKIAQAAVPIAAAFGSYLALTSGPIAAMRGPRSEVKRCCRNPSTGAVVCQRAMRRGFILACPDGLEEADCPKETLAVCDA
ncbi:MAG TPA: hypothetical protein VJ809_07265 [Pirellulales bacterium]|jgi:hypothetical protein|nr:hypothetical protein [Pirellulales bacterium]